MARKIAVATSTILMIPIIVSAITMVGVIVADHIFKPMK